ncbi:peptidylprolyl isomerase [Nanoarchaeota archaeon]
MAVKTGEFIEIEYTGMIKEDSFVFDTTNEKIAKDNNIHDPKSEYTPIVICIGQGQLIKGLDADIEGKDVGKDYTIDVLPENAFGKKSAKLLKLVPTSVFRKQNIVPQVGLPVNIDGTDGTIKTVTGGRTIVDFNHPLSGREITYKYKILKMVTDDAEKIKSLLSVVLNIPMKNIDVKVDQGKATIEMAKMPEPIEKEFAKKIKELISTIKDVKFTEKGAKKPKTTDIESKKQ